MGKNKKSCVFSAGLPAYIYTNSLIYWVMTSTVLNMAALSYTGNGTYIVVTPWANSRKIFATKLLCPIIYFTDLV